MWTVSREGLMTQLPLSFNEHVLPSQRLRRALKMKSGEGWRTEFPSTQKFRACLRARGVLAEFCATVFHSGGLMQGWGKATLERRPGIQ